MKRCLALLPLFFLAAPVHALTIRVGADAGCDTASIAVALTQAKANPGADTIRLAANQNYTNQELFIDSDVTLRGGYANCDAATPAGRTAIGGSGTWAAVTAWTDGANGIAVRLEGLDVRNGGASGDVGDFGGISVGGRARVTLADMRIHDNVGIYGGGVSVNGTNAIVNVERDVEVDNNRASLGGGFAVGGGTLRFNPYGVVVRDNRAAAGGGLFIDSGLASVGGDPDLALPADGLLIRNNTASSEGGGVYVRGSTGKLLAESTVIRDNTAGTEGGGAYATDGGYVQFVRYAMGPQRPCSAERECLRLSGNTAPRGGGIALAGGANGALFHSLIRDNTANDGPAISVRGQTSELRLLGSVVARNRCSGSNVVCAPIRTTAGKLRFSYTTIADNSAGTSMPSPIFADGASGDSATRYEFYSTLISGHAQLYAQNGATISHAGDCLIMSAGQIWSGLTRSDIAPIDFVDAARGNYRLRAGNAAIDYCTASQAPTEDPDIDGTPRGLESPGNANDFGTVDVGAYEYERIFGSGFEAAR
ncbi:MAG TPA: hypothetical protein VLF18_15510 [Tahibacter sp.]|uniref:hypothetical protein n=1 Tax=Tahibacter sp. TaxID=2056211 RepID=UPI002C4042A8|nr:hypothetical protein [Tahibacter sp.]HSX61608.1 hypothetical protein [Tahibacter sp.]